jgi:DNA mismatch repair protein MSH5
LSNHELGQLLDENMTEEDIRDLEDAEAVFRRFLAWDIEGDRKPEMDSASVKEKLAIVLGR